MRSPAPPALSPMSFQGSPAPLWLCSPGSEAAVPHSKATGLSLPYPSLLCAMAWILKHAHLCQERKPRRFQKTPRRRTSAIELTSPLLDSCLTVRFGVSCRALHLAPIPCADDPKFPALSPGPAWCSPPRWFNSLQNLVQWDNSHSFVEVRT